MVACTPDVVPLFDDPFLLICPRDHPLVAELLARERDRPGGLTPPAPSAPVRLVA